MPKILEVKKVKNSVYIKVEGIDSTFYFDLKDTKDEAELKARLKYSVECELKNIAKQNTEFTKLETWVGTDAAN